MYGQSRRPPRPLQPDPTFWRPGDSWVNEEGPRAATVCRRGHPIEITLTVAPSRDLGFCNECGAQIIGRCPTCNIRIRGMETGLVGAMTKYAPPKFCDGCGEPLPWANRQDYIYQLENLLDTEEIDQHTRLLVLEDLERLRTEADLGQDKQVEVWKRIKDRAPGLFMGSATKIVQSLITAYVSQKLGI
nr:DUF2321 domain-containing protein [Trebonia sp.]